jgi:hypothetical protein
LNYLNDWQEAIRTQVQVEILAAPPFFYLHQAKKTLTYGKSDVAV